jgi:hypothetical protein
MAVVRNVHASMPRRGMPRVLMLMHDLNRQGFSSTNVSKRRQIQSSEWEKLVLSTAANCRRILQVRH